jgi:hypothetical protein
VKPVHLVRWGIPLVLIIVGTIIVLGDTEAVGEALIAAAVCVIIANLLMRLGFSDAKDRDREEAAREYYDEHGRWPDES